jgi:hypothetical protein
MKYGKFTHYNFKTTDVSAAWLIYFVMLIVLIALPFA